MEAVDEPTIASSQRKGVAAPASVPFDAGRLDALMEEAGIDALVVTSKHNIQYLLGGYRFFFFDHFDAIGVSRYLPVLIYVKGRPERAAYIGHPMERYEQELGRFWVPTFLASARTSTDGIEAAIEKLGAIAPGAKRIGIERASCRPTPRAHSAKAGLSASSSRRSCRSNACGRSRRRRNWKPCVLRAISSSIRCSRSWPAQRRACQAGTGRGAPPRGSQPWPYLRILPDHRGRQSQPGAVRPDCARGRYSLADFGGNYKGYIGDLCRMGVFGEPDAELKDLLAEVDAIQQAARRPIRHGARGGDVFAAAEELTRRSSHGNCLEFVAHGMGLISHEAPRLTDRGPVPYPAHDADLPLQKGMVLSIETAILHPRRGFIKLEDTVAVTEGGSEGFGDRGRGWNRCGAGGSGLPV